MVEDLTNSPQGTEAGGFRVMPGLGGRRLVVECWGYWDDATVALFLQQSLAALDKAAFPLDFTLDAVLLKPQSAAGQEAVRGFLKQLAAKSLSRVGVRVDNVLTRMQLTRLLRESRLESAQFSSSSGLPPAGRF